MRGSIKHAWVALVALIVALVFVGCGDDDPGSGSSSSASGSGSSSGAIDGGSTSSGGTSSSGSTTSSSGGESDGGSDAEGGTSGPVPDSLVHRVVPVTRVAFEFATLNNTDVWVRGFYGPADWSGDAKGTLIDKPRRFFVDEAFPEHSFIRLDGTLPPADWGWGEVLLFGTIKDYATTTGNTAVFPTPLLTVTKSVKLADKSLNVMNSWDHVLLPEVNLTVQQQASGSGSGMSSQHSSPFFDSSSARVRRPELPERVHVRNSGPVIVQDGLTGTQASSCDRSVIISGGVDASNNEPRYIDNLIGKFTKMEELGFTQDQIKVFYNNGGPIDVLGTNIVDEKASKQKIQEHLTQLAADMPGSCTLTVFVTDHGTGYTPSQGYEGARRAKTGPDATGGKLFNEGTFEVDLRGYAFRRGEFEVAGQAFTVSKSEANELYLWFKLPDGKWKLAKDTNGDGQITETEASGDDSFVDFDGDGDADSDTFFTNEYLNGKLAAEVHHYDEEMDTDRDGTNDVRFHWDGTKYVAEQWTGSAWQMMGADTNGDLHIDAADGGLDWNLDGDKSDQVGFHEGINLWGNEVLWDDELATMLKPLADKGVHIMMEMVSCFSGGLVENLKGVGVENAVAGSAEDTKHSNYFINGKYRAVDETEFLKNLVGIDSKSWSTAWTAAVAADVAAATAAGQPPNQNTRYETPSFTSTSKFEAIGNQGDYNLEVATPLVLTGQVFDFEIIYGLQTPRWTGPVTFPEGLPAGLSQEPAPGGIRVYSASPLPNPLKIKIKGTPGATEIRVGLTDVLHKSFGYTMAAPGTVVIPAQIHVSAVTGAYRHFRTYSEVYGSVTVVNAAGQPVPNATVTLTNNNGPPITSVGNASGVSAYIFTINTYATYTVRVTNVTATNSVYVPAQNVVSQVVVVVGP